LSFEAEGGAAATPGATVMIETGDGRLLNHH
jgi:hypothetical protein